MGPWGNPWSSSGALGSLRGPRGPCHPIPPWGGPPGPWGGPLGPVVPPLARLAPLGPTWPSWALVARNSLARRGRDASGKPKMALEGHPESPWAPKATQVHPSPPKTPPWGLVLGGSPIAALLGIPQPASWSVPGRRGTARLVISWPPPGPFLSPDEIYPEDSRGKVPIFDSEPLQNPCGSTTLTRKKLPSCP